jgi:hypothetical protein
VNIEAGERFVEENGPRFEHQGPCNGNALALATGELARMATSGLRELVVLVLAPMRKISVISNFVWTKLEPSVNSTSMIERRITEQLRRDLAKKMVLLSGPRQCGKTTLVLGIARKQKGLYLNWDDPADRRLIQTLGFDFAAPAWFFDELHKFRRWRNFLKGLYDTHHDRHRILVTGSARLDLYGRGGDSLQGRYFHHHLHPLTASEVARRAPVALDELARLPNRPVPADALDAMLTLGGFPEPFLSGSKKEADRWRIGYAARLVQEEVRNLEQIRELERVELLYERLGAVAGSILSINSLREDLEVAFETVRSWIAILEKIDAIFRIPPYGPPRIKGVKKQQKLYFWDWSRAESEGARFENMVALHLLRLVDWARDVEGEKLELRYFRTRMGHEVDFLLLRNAKPWIAIETKLSEQPLDHGMRYMLERVPVPYAFQVYAHVTRERRAPDIGSSRVRHVSAARLLASLP